MLKIYINEEATNSCNIPSVTTYDGDKRSSKNEVYYFGNPPKPPMSLRDYFDKKDKSEKNNKDWFVLINILSTIALILSLGGNILVNYQKRFGFIIWGVSNIFWILVNFLGNLNVPQVIMYVIYLILNIQGFIIWSKKNDS